MKRELRAVLSSLADELPGPPLAFYARAPLGDRRFTWMAGRVEEILGYPARAFMGDPGFWRSVLHPADRDRAASLLSDLHLDPTIGAMSLRYRVLSSDGEERRVRDDLRVVRTAAGAPAELLGVMRDVTAEDRLARRAASLEERLWEAQRMETLGALAGGIAHDFNNLLTAILSSVRLVENDPGLAAESRGDLEIIRDAARRGGAMVRQILDFAGRARGSVSVVDVSLVIEEMRPILARSLGPEIRLDVECEEGLPPIKADSARIEQVVLNLAVNAREAMPGGGRLRIRASREDAADELAVEGGRLPSGPYLKLSVRDDGVGIPDRVRERIFEPFFSTKRRSGTEAGSGVGLATVQRVVQGYGGGIRVETLEGRGTVFHVYLPFVRPTSGASPEVLAAEASAGRPEAIRILVVEDDPGVREVIKRVLIASGYAVSAVGTAAEGLQVFDRVRPPFDLLVADVVLPDRTGPQLYGALSRRVPELPVLYMSGYGQEAVIRRGGDDAGASFLAKPFEPEELRARVREILAARGKGLSDQARGLGGGATRA